MLAEAALPQAMQQFLFTHLSTRDGLASDETMGVQQDKEGFIWIATLAGLQRYDGKRLLTFHNSVGNRLSIPNDMIRSIQLDKKNRLWLFFGENKVGWFNVSDFTFHQALVDLPEDSPEKPDGRLFLDSSGKIMLLLSGSGIFTYSEKDNLFAERYNPFLYPKTWKANWVMQDQLQHNYWIACDSGLVKFNVAKKTLSYRDHNTDQDEVIAAYAHLRWVSIPYLDRAGRFWVLSWPSKEQTYFYSYGLSSKKIAEWESQINDSYRNSYYYIDRVEEQKDGSFWVIGGNLLARMNVAGTAFEVVKNNLPGEFSIRYDALKNIFEDRENNLWLSSNNGLFRLNPASQFFHVILNKRAGKDTIYNSNVSDILQTKNGNILVSTWGDGLFSYDTNFAPLNSGYINQSQKLGENLTWCICQRQNGDIWRGNQYGTIYISYAKSARSEKIQPAVFEGRNIRQIIEDKNGDLWLGTINGDLIKWDSLTKKFSVIKKLNTNIEKLYADIKGNIWVCTRGRGLYKINCNTGAVAENYTASGPSGRKLMQPYAMDIISYDDSLYMIASGAINILNSRTNTISFLAKGTEFPVNNISNLIKDRLGKVWVTSLRGLSCVDLKKHITSYYDQRDGVHTNSFTGASATMLNDGRIAIGTSHDVMVFDPAVINNANYYVPRIHITGFYLMNKALPMDSLNKLKSIELQYNKNAVTIEFSMLTYQNTFGINYKLEGLDKDWKNDYFSNEAIYTYLPPGNYTFKLKIENGDPTGVVTYTLLKIRVKPPFWKTWWFFGLLAFAAIGIIYWLDKFRIERIRETERVRTRIATSLTKDMTNTLGNINVLSELAKVRLDKDKERTREYIGQISDNSSRMMEVMDDMIWSINPENDELQYTILRMKKYAATIQSKYDLEISFTVNKKVMDLKLQMDRRHELFLIFKEALLNIGKHANSKFADIDIRLEKSKLKIAISDNGRGFNTLATNFGRGLNDMRKKAAALNANIIIRSTENTGTEVVLEMNP